MEKKGVCQRNIFIIHLGTDEISEKFSRTKIISNGGWWPLLLNRTSRRVPYALPQRNSWPNITPSLELVHEQFLLMLKIYGTHYHHIFAMQLHFDSSRNYWRLINLDINTRLFFSHFWLEHLEFGLLCASSVGAF